MYKILSNKSNKIYLTLLILGVGVGLLLTVQWKTPVVRVSNPITPYVSLKDTRNDLIKEQDDLKNQISKLQIEISEKQKELKKYNTSKKMIEEIEDYKDRIGLVEMTGEGVTIVLDDAVKTEMNADSITHAADLRDIVNFLWSIGVQAISINEERIVFATSIDCIVNTILINSTKKIPPFIIQAIGNSKTIEKQLVNPSNLKDIKKRVKTQGLVFDVKKSKNITIYGYNGSFVIENVKIME